MHSIEVQSSIAAPVAGVKRYPDPGFHPALSMSTIWTLQHLAGPPLRLQQALADGLGIGRALDNDLVLLDPAVSRQQARLQLVDDAVFLHALGGSTRINDRAIAPGETVELAAGDRLGFGPWQLRLARLNERIVPASLAPTLARDRLGLVHQFCRRASDCRDPETLLAALLDAALHGSGCDRVLLLTPQAPYRIDAARPEGAADEGFSHSLVAASFQGMVQLEHLDAQPSESMLALGITQALCLPLPGDECGRVLYLDCRDSAAALPPQAAIFVQTLVESAGLALTRLAREQAMARQGEELWRDLHDELGSFLLGKVYASTTPEAASVAREALAEVRRLVNASRVLGGDSRSLLAALQTECEERCAAAGCELRWDGDVGERELAERGALDLLRLVREWVSNALRHGRVEHLSITLVDRDESLQMEFVQPLTVAATPAPASAEGEVNWPIEWRRGNGLRSIENRLGRLHGRGRCETRGAAASRSLCLVCEIPWRRVQQ